MNGRAFAASIWTMAEVHRSETGGVWNVCLEENCQFTHFQPPCIFIAGCVETRRHREAVERFIAQHSLFSGWAFCLFCLSARVTWPMTSSQRALAQCNAALDVSRRSAVSEVVVGLCENLAVNFSCWKILAERIDNWHPVDRCECGSVDFPLGPWSRTRPLLRTVGSSSPTH